MFSSWLSPDMIDFIIAALIAFAIVSVYLLIRRGREVWREKLQEWLDSDRDKDGLRPRDILTPEQLAICNAAVNRNWIGKNSFLRLIRKWLEKMQVQGLRAAWWNPSISLLRLVLLPVSEGRTIVRQFLDEAETRAAKGVSETPQPPLPKKPE